MMLCRKRRGAAAAGKEAGREVLEASDIADAILYALSRRPPMAINEVRQADEAAAIIAAILRRS
jgi:NADP-dependent 3-hydroxy acid dehydrogenase YdfG